MRISRYVARGQWRSSDWWTKTGQFVPITRKIDFCESSMSTLLQTETDQSRRYVCLLPKYQIFEGRGLANRGFTCRNTRSSCHLTLGQMCNASLSCGQSPLSVDISITLVSYSYTKENPRKKQACTTHVVIRRSRRRFSKFIQIVPHHKTHRERYYTQNDNNTRCNRIKHQFLPPRRRVVQTDEQVIRKVTQWRCHEEEYCS